MADQAINVSQLLRRGVRRRFPPQPHMTGGTTGDHRVSFQIHHGEQPVDPGVGAEIIDPGDLAGSPPSQIRDCRGHTLELVMGRGMDLLRLAGVARHAGLAALVSGETGVGVDLGCHPAGLPGNKASNASHTASF